MFIAFAAPSYPFNLSLVVPDNIVRYLRNLSLIPETLPARPVLTVPYLGRILLWPTQTTADVFDESLPTNNIMSIARLEPFGNLAR